MSSDHQRVSYSATTLELLLAAVSACALALCFSSSAAEAQSMNASPSVNASSVVEATPLPRGMRRVTWPIARRAFVTGDTVHATDFALRDTVIMWPWNTAPDTTRAIDGWIARRPIMVGEVLRTPAVSAPPIVSAGTTVTAIWQDGSLRLVLTGVATNSAPLGAPVSVRIDRSRRLDGVAIAPNTVRLR